MIFFIVRIEIPSDRCSAASTSEILKSEKLKTAILIDLKLGSVGQNFIL